MSKKNLVILFIFLISNKKYIYIYILEKEVTQVYKKYTGVKQSTQ